jgi:hypothetical protein
LFTPAELRSKAEVKSFLIGRLTRLRFVLPLSRNLKHFSFKYQLNFIQVFRSFVAEKVGYNKINESWEYPPQDVGLVGLERWRKFFLRDEIFFKSGKILNLIQVFGLFVAENT